jgi:hypothetical protein
VPVSTIPNYPRLLDAEEWAELGLEDAGLDLEMGFETGLALDAGAEEVREAGLAAGLGACLAWPLKL